MEHNHLTRDIKPPGECPACDETRVSVPATEPVAVPTDTVFTVEVGDALAGIARLHLQVVGDVVVPEVGQELAVRIVGVDNG